MSSTSFQDDPDDRNVLFRPEPENSLDSEQRIDQITGSLANKLTIHHHHSGTIDEIRSPMANELRNKPPLNPSSDSFIMHKLDFEIQLYRANDRIKQLEDKLSKKVKRIAQLEAVVKGYKQKKKREARECVKVKSSRLPVSYSFQS